MDTVCYRKSVSWIAVTVVLRLMASGNAQQGFISIHCGGQTDYTDKNRITWVPDTKYINVSQTETAYIGDYSEMAYGSYLQSIRIFPKPLNKSCYQLPLTPNVPTLVRVWFAVGNYSGFQNLTSFVISFETLGMLTFENVTIKDTDPYYLEIIMVSSGTMLYICLIRTLETDDPFISTIEMRTLLSGMYEQAQPGTMLRTYWRINVGGYSVIRYNDDNFDRVWTKDINISNQTSSLVQAQVINSQQLISVANTKNVPPPGVMQTGWVMNTPDFQFRLGSVTGTKALLVLYFAELETLNVAEPRSFYIAVNGEIASPTINTVLNYSALEFTFQSNKTDNFTFDLVNATNSSSGPIINAFEFYSLIETAQATNSQDIEALGAIKSTFSIEDWISDPCYLIQWNGIGCDHTSSAIRISEINLSGWNLTGSVPDNITLLNALVNVSLDNNHLIGTFPNFSGLNTLERLYLQNNNISGSIPDWLPELKNLKELFIQNNNFSGVIPAQLLNMPLLKFNYSGNPHLCIDKEDCILPKNRNNKVMVIVGITVGGILMIGLALVVVMVVYRKKFNRRAAVPTESSGLEAGSNHLAYHDSSMIMMSNTRKCRAFSLDEMMAATENFSGKIGQGGFGSVFFGKLPEGKHIAVKVLSLSSKQGLHEFRNEVDLLSRVHHRNLVSLLGFCNESKELMLVYEHMSGGSLRDHLYDLSARSLELKWKERVQIALDAAQGLEYLHVGCTPKIIHRDVKTSNILLDSNLNGKLADFGLSKMTNDGDATHITTVVKGTAGYLDPEYFNTQMLSEKSDVYSFGVVLLEIICGRQPVDINLPVKEINLLRWAIPYVEKDENLPEIIDKRLGENYDLKSITRVAKVAIRCAQAEPSSRPSVSEIVAELKEAIKHEESSFISNSEENIESSCDILGGPDYISMDSSENKGMDSSASVDDCNPLLLNYP